ncbi:MAG: ABC transporter permease [Tepidanaerobacter acetatoxydans]|uniref:ABC transporter permease n=1 Tax=Tepidanaerobacter TaxID=499228 RepID=UPI000ABDD3C9|nr:MULTISPECIES: ABC transporter permease [Tepidanaerobacter]NLU10709.1 ABC transporter permease [Tepidanaerobacter acetatoxydans]
MKRLLKNNEFTVAIIIAITWLIFGIVNPDIISLANVYSITRASIISATFALACMLVIISGGIDMSFFAVGCVAMYVTVKYLVDRAMLDTPLFLIFAAAIIIGIILELINWFFIDKLNLPPFIVTIGSQSLYKGFLLAFVGTTYITTMPKGMRKLAVTYVSSTTSSSGIVYNLHFLVIVVAAMYIIMHIVLNFTRFGRNIYAIGADVAAAQRAGINISRTRFLVFLIAGAIAGVGGVFQGTLNRAAVPADLVGQELLVIAAVVLGGGGGKQARGSVLGTALGVILLSLISNNLILMKVPSYWQQAVTGIIILIGLIIQSTEAISKL